MAELKRRLKIIYSSSKDSVNMFCYLVVLPSLFLEEFMDMPLPYRIIIILVACVHGIFMFDNMMDGEMVSASARWLLSIVTLIGVALASYAITNELSSLFLPIGVVFVYTLFGLFVVRDR